MGRRSHGGKDNWYGDWRTVTVTYRREDSNVVVTKVGYGNDYYESLKDADEQLRPGAWVRLAISQPSSVLADVRNAGKHRQTGNHKRHGEGETVIQLPPQSRVPAGVERTDD